MSRRNNAARKYQQPQSGQTAALLNALATLQISPVMLELLQLLQQDPSTVERLKEFLSQPRTGQKEKATPVQGGGRAVHPVSVNASSLTHLQPKSLEPKLQTVKDDSEPEYDYQPPLAGLTGPMAVPIGDTNGRHEREKKAIGYDYNESVYLAEAKRLIALKVPEHIWTNPDLIPAQMRGAITRILTIMLAWANFPLFRAVFGGSVMTLPLEVFRAEAGLQAARLRVSGDKKNKKGQAESAFYIMQYVGLIETVQSVPEGSYRPGDITLPGYILPAEFHRLKELAYELPKRRGGQIFTSRTFQEGKTNFYRLKSDVCELLASDLPEFNPWHESDVRAGNEILSQTLVKRSGSNQPLTSDYSDLSQTLVRPKSNVLAQKGLTEPKIRQESDVLTDQRLTQPRSLKKNHEEEKEEEDSHGSHANTRFEPNRPVKHKSNTTKLDQNLALLAQTPDCQVIYGALIEFVTSLTGHEPSDAFIRGAYKKAISNLYSLDYLGEVFASMRHEWETGQCDEASLEKVTLWRIGTAGGDLTKLRRLQERRNPLGQEQRRAVAAANYNASTAKAMLVAPAVGKVLAPTTAGGKIFANRKQRPAGHDVAKSALKYVQPQPNQEDAPVALKSIGKLNQQLVDDCWPEVLERLASKGLPVEAFEGCFTECDSQEGAIKIFLQKEKVSKYLTGGIGWKSKTIEAVLKSSFFNVKEVLVREVL